MDEAAEAGVWRAGWINQLVSRPGFQSWASRFPLTRGRARRDGAALFDILQGFVASQALSALIELNVLHHLKSGPKTAETLGRALDVPKDRMQVLLQSGAALRLLRRRRDGRFGLARQGAALLGVPGLEAMIRHHTAFYADMADPVALLRGPETTELSQFWPYVFGAKGDVPDDVARTYSDLMAQSQGLVAEDTLRAVSLRGVRRLLDVGGGTGAFLSAVGAAWPDVALELFDLPQVVPAATERFAAAGLMDRTTIHSGSFRDDPLPLGADAISLIRVLYDHQDATVRALLSKIFDALPPGGRLIVSEPMAGGTHPERAGDVYFAFYTMAMQTGRARSASEIIHICQDIGFQGFTTHRVARPFVTSVISARKPG